MAFEKINVDEIDASWRMVQRTLLQFRQSPVFHDMLSKFAEEIQEFLDACRDTMRLRSCQEALTSQLDAIGRIVGQGRVLTDYDTLDWFTPDISYRSVDQTPAWVQNAPLDGDLEMGNVDFRKFIEAKIARNMTQFGSVPEIQDMVKTALGINISVVWVAPMTVKLVVPDNTSNNDLALLARHTDTDKVESFHFLNLPATCQISQVVRISEA